MSGQLIPIGTYVTDRATATPWLVVAHIQSPAGEPKLRIKRGHEIVDVHPGDFKPVEGW